MPDARAADLKNPARLRLAIKLAALASFLVATNLDIGQRIALLVDQQRYDTLVLFMLLWGVCIGAISAAAFHPKWRVRLFWAVIFSASTALMLGFRRASQAEFGIFDAVSLWNARHESARALAFYGDAVVWAAAIFAIGIAVVAAPAPLTNGRVRRLLARTGWTPFLPIALIAAIVFLKEGGGAHALPTQVTAVSVAIVSGAALASADNPPRRAVATKPDSRSIRKVVVLVDESVRGDYIDWTPGNPYTPELARLKDRIVDFGPAASGGNCSHYSNAILRFVAARDDLGRNLISNPTIWQFAKQAGYRTVFIDAQAGFVRNPGKLQNFMTVEETRAIDKFHAIDDSATPSALDDRLLDVMLQELRSDWPVFVYANKNGAHFPYDRGYPAAERLFTPTMSEAGDSEATRINSYRNVLKWSVDRFFKRLFTEADLSDTVVIYTSDHGQTLRPGLFSHCSLEKPDPREALVPLFAVTGDARMQTRLSAAAVAQRGHASHFSIAPTALELMGYDRRALSAVRGASLLAAPETTTAFTTGDIFGLFSGRVRWHELDLTKSYLESMPQTRASAEATTR